ncbi:MAG: ABC transporter ATP-binding protein [Dehalococcoidales bacterium]|nr:ABC transporter ATP-binding protein [Dehalococcoidales bacterium]
MADILEVRNLTTHFYTEDGVVRAVNGVSYSVARGETIALVGESGCGKTVSALSILRLIKEPPGKILSGEVIFDGADLLKLSGEELRKVRGDRISMIFQEPMTSLNPVLTVGRQISEALEFHQQMTKEGARNETIRLLDLVGIPQPQQRVKNYPHQFSGGMRQRVMIAMAISCQPQLIIADEPTTALDVTIQAQLLEVIRDITRELQTALILITHNLGVVARYARRVYVMYAGQVVEHGLSRDVYKQPAHPYTAGLLASVPRLDESVRIRLKPIEGQPPDLTVFPEGCVFRPRCVYRSDDCHKGSEELTEVTAGHYSACARVQESARLWQGV